MPMTTILFRSLDHPVQCPGELEWTVVWESPYLLDLEEVNTSNFQGVAFSVCEGVSDYRSWCFRNAQRGLTPSNNSI